MEIIVPKWAEKVVNIYRHAHPPPTTPTPHTQNVMFVCVLSCYSASLMLYCLNDGMLEVLENNGDISEMHPEALQKSRS